MNSASRPQACPFVALDDDRDSRSEAPDPRHRCFAVPNPEPRAIAHQQAYCLTPNFPSCAFFMDWAARAAAAPQAGSGAGFGAAPAAGSYGNYGAYGGQASDVESPGAADPGGRTWAAPPPWVAEPELGSTQQPAVPAWSQPAPGAAAPSPPLAPAAWTPPPLIPPQLVPPQLVPPQPTAARTPPPATPPYAAPPPALVPPSMAMPASAGESEQLTALPEAEESEADRDYDLSGDQPLDGAMRAPEATSPYQRPAPQPTSAADPARAYAASAGINEGTGVLPVPAEAYPADMPPSMDHQATLAPLPPSMPMSQAPPVGPSTAAYAPPVGPSYAAVPPSVPSLPPASMPSFQAPPEDWFSSAGPDAWSHPVEAYGALPDLGPALSSQQEEARSRLTGRPVETGGPPRFSPQARQPVKKRTDGEWSKPRRFEAYPTLSARMRLSPVLVGAFAIAIVALLLFLLPGFLGGAGVLHASHSPATATATLEPTPTPQPTPASYTVKGGDVLSTVAKSTGRTVEQLACFNNLKNVNSLSIGQVLLIPPADYVCPPKPSPTKK